jgi:hypothetical protein
VNSSIRNEYSNMFAKGLEIIEAMSSTFANFHLSRQHNKAAIELLDQAELKENVQSKVYNDDGSRASQALWRLEWILKSMLNPANVQVYRDLNQLVEKMTGKVSKASQAGKVIDVHSLAVEQTQAIKAFVQKHTSEDQPAETVVFRFFLGAITSSLVAHEIIGPTVVSHGGLNDANTLPSYVDAARSVQVNVVASHGAPGKKNVRFAGAATWKPQSQPGSGGNDDGNKVCPYDGKFLDSHGKPWENGKSAGKKQPACWFRHKCNNKHNDKTTLDMFDQLKEQAVPLKGLRK